MYSTLGDRPCSLANLCAAKYVIVVAVVFSPRTNEANRVNSTVMERDLRITGRLRGQSGNPEPPKGFEVSNPWRVRMSSLFFLVPRANSVTDRETDVLKLILLCQHCHAVFAHTHLSPSNEV